MHKLILLALLSWPISLINMEPLSITSAMHLPPEIKKHIKDYAQLPQWWYLRHMFDNHIHTMCFDYSGELLATGGCGRIRIFELEQDKEITSFTPQAEINLLCFNHSATELATCTCYGDIQLFDLKEKKMIFLNQNLNNVSSISFDYTGKLIAATIGLKVDIFDVKQNKIITSFDHEERRSSSCFDHTGRFLAISGANGNAHVFDLKHSIKIASANHSNDIESLCITDAGKILVADKAWTWLHDIQTRIIDIDQNKVIAYFNHDNKVNSVCFDYSGKLFATGSKDKKARVFALYENDTLEQRILKTVLNTWILIEKPPKELTTRDMIWSDVALKCFDPRLCITKDMLTAIWFTFPRDMRKALWRTLHYKIKKYGKFPCKEATNSYCSIQ